MCECQYCADRGEKECPLVQAGAQVASTALLAFYEDVAPFLRRLREPRFDSYETNDYVCGSTDCKNALAALDAIEANAGAVPRRGSDVGTIPLLAVSESGDK